MIELYRDDLVHALCSVRISSDKRTITFTLS